MSDVHVDTDLSAYLDEQLAPAERARVESHLATCGRCARRLADLRSTASLIAALPSPRPSRSLVPPLEARWTWLRPIRSLSALAAGAFLFVFLLTAVGTSGSGLGGGTGAPARANAPAASPASQFATTATTATAAPAAPQRNVGGAAQSTAAPAAAPAGVADSASQKAATAAPAAELNDRARSLSVEPAARNPVLDPRAWLVAAILAGAIALFAHVRLRRGRDIS